MDLYYCRFCSFCGRFLLLQNRYKNSILYCNDNRRYFCRFIFLFQIIASQADNNSGAAEVEVGCTAFVV